MRNPNQKRMMGLLIAAGVAMCLLSAGTVVRAQAGGTISGKVTDATTNTPMRGVTVQVFDTAGDPQATAVSTDASGNYSFTGLAPGGYLVQEVAPGYQQTNPTFPNIPPNPHSTLVFPSWNYTGVGGVGPGGWMNNGTTAPFESGITLSAPTVNLDSILGLHYSTAPTSPATIRNTGYQVQAQFPGNASENVTVNGVPFNLSNVHFHNPTENQVAGASYTMEEHLVNTSPQGGLTVLAAFIQLGNVVNPSLESLFGSLSHLGTAAGSSLSGSGVSLNFADLLPSNHQGWYYPGSLTTPPLSTPVNWFVFATPIEMTTQEYAEYLAFANAAGFGLNARPVQDLNGRQINNLNYAYLASSGSSVTGLDFNNIAAVPEPSSWALFGLGAAGLAGYHRRRRERPAA